MLVRSFKGALGVHWVERNYFDLNRKFKGSRNSINSCIPLQVNEGSSFVASCKEVNSFIGDWVKEGTCNVLDIPFIITIITANTYETS